MFETEAESRAFFGSANFVVLLLIFAGCSAALYRLAQKNRGVRAVMIALLAIALFWAGFVVVRVLNLLLLLGRAGGP